MRPAITVLDTKEKVQNFAPSDEYVIIARINPQDPHIKTAYEALASQYRDRLSFGLVTPKAAATTVSCYNNRDSQQFATSDLSAIDALPKLISDCLEPVIGEFTRASEIKYLQSGKSLVFYFAGASSERDAYVDAMRSVAKMYKEYLLFVTVDANEYGDLAEPLGLRAGKFPALSVQNPMFGQVFPYSGGREIKPEAVGGFLMDIVQGKVKPWDGTMEGEDKGADEHDEL